MVQFNANGPIPDHTLRIYTEKNASGNSRYVIKNSYQRVRSFDNKRDAELWLTHNALGQIARGWGYI